MSDKNTAPVEATEVTEDVKPAKPVTKQIAASFTEDELAWIREALFAKRQLKPTELVRSAVLEYIKDVPKP